MLWVKKKLPVMLLFLVQYLETNELLFGEAMTVDYLDLFDQRTLSTLRSP